MEETIAAIATAYGEGGIGIIRISGPEAGRILNQVFCPVRRRRKRGEGLQPEALEVSTGMPIVNRQFTYGYVVEWVKCEDGGQREEIVDEAMAVLMKGPATYTAEDVAEIQCHGSVVSLRRTLDLVLRCGARLAEPGEFTKRAFLNGRIDLAQAEAVIDVVRAKTDRSFSAAVDQMEGRLSRQISDLRNRVTEFLSLVIVNLDYPDEDIEEVTYDLCRRNLEEIAREIDVLLRSADTGKILREGLSVSIIGRPNVGKSSLLNALLGESRAIVTEIPGTTRDVIEEGLSIRGIPIRLTDTAGIRKTWDQIEQMGIEKTRKSYETADLILFVIDSGSELSQEDREIAEQIGDKRAIILFNKSDLGQRADVEEICRLLPGRKWIAASMKDGAGIEELKDEIESMVYQGEVHQENSAVVTNVRHRDLLRRAAESIEDALSMVERGEALDFVEMDLRSCWEFLGEITGDAVSADIIDEVFSRFCLGK